MKIAFVCQPFDVVVPPCLNSVGYYTWGITRALHPAHSVAVYACAQANKHADSSASPFPLHLVESSSRDIALFRARTELGRMVDVWDPLSTWSLLYPDYGRRVAIELSREQWDVIHIQHCSQFAPLIRKYNPRSKIVLQLHAEWFSQSNFARLSERLQSIDILLGVSDHISQKLKWDFPKIASRCRVLHYGVDPAEFTREKDYSALAGRKEKRIVFAGAVSPQKGPHVLLEAFQILARRIPDVHLEFAGGLTAYPIEESFDVADTATVRAVKPYYRKMPIKHVAQRLGLMARTADRYSEWLRGQVGAGLAERVSFSGHIGERSSLVDRYYDADVFVFPPIWDEGFGIPPIEAMASGTPVVGSRSGGLLETVDDGVTGFLVEKNSSLALADRIEELLADSDKRQRMGRAAKERVLSRFSWPVIAGQMTRMYEGTLDPPAPQAHGWEPLQEPVEQLATVDAK